MNNFVLITLFALALLSEEVPLAVFIKFYYSPQSEGIREKKDDDIWHRTAYVAEYHRTVDHQLWFLLLRRSRDNH